jgi:hypothetical protein
MKNKNIEYLFALILFTLTPALHASTMSLQTERGKITIPELKNWELGKDMFGMPFIYFSPQQNGQRSNISFTATGVELESSLNDLAKDAAGYQKIKKDWANTVQAKVQGFTPYKQWKNNNGHVVHEVGFNYLHKNKNYVEHSYYINCRERLVYAKSLRLTSNADHQEHFKKLIQDMDCSL